jgi:ABC-type branched-subunit amino acid transport system substrate-binding protein
MAAAVNWNIPVIGYLSSDDSLSDKTVFSTLARTTVISATFFAQAVKYVVMKNGWKKVAYVGDSSSVDQLNRQAVISALNPIGISVYNMVISNVKSWQNISSSQAIVKLKANARGKNHRCTWGPKLGRNGNPKPKIQGASEILKTCV